MYNFCPNWVKCSGHHLETNKIREANGFTSSKQAKAAFYKEREERVKKGKKEKEERQGKERKINRTGKAKGTKREG